MNDFFARFGLFSMAVFILFIAKKVEEYLYFRKVDREHYNFDEVDDDL